ncbi:MAG TPA: hypothetical protein VI757_16200 [Bacteroidia bacterium]|nr:hypothetical protein [Bacteroidia bacterium]
MKYILTLTVACMLLSSCSTSPTTESNAQESDMLKPDSLKNISLDTLKAQEEIINTKTDTPVQAVQKAEKKRAGNTRGKISHLFRKSGCATVIIVQGNEGDAELVLIPKDALKKELDTDGQMIYFNYHPLKMPNPPGCVKGMPAEITDMEAE